MEHSHPNTKEYTFYSATRDFLQNKSHIKPQNKSQQTGKMKYPLASIIRQTTENRQTPQLIFITHSKMKCVSDERRKFKNC